MRILITNDDGIYCKGLDVLVKSLSEAGEVFVVVPDRQRSGASRSMTLHEPIRMRKIENNKYIVNGTPSDCVRLGCIILMKQNVDMVVSGINAGANLGDDTGYSGTVGGAMEGCMHGIPSFAMSLVVMGRDSNNYESAGKVTLRVVDKLLKHKLPKNTYLNVNVPDLPYEKLKGLAVTYQGKRIYPKKIEKLFDPKGRSYYWLSAENSSGWLTKGSDLEAISRKLVSVSPLTLDFTNYKMLGELRKWEI